MKGSSLLGGGFYMNNFWKILLNQFFVLIIVFVPLFLQAQIEEGKTFPTPDSLLSKVGQENVDTSYSFQWNEGLDLWEIHSRELLFYNQKHKLFTLIVQEWIAVDSTWKNTERDIKEYNDNGKLHQTLHQSWNEEANNWVNLELKTFIYNKRGKKSEILYQQWRRALGEWISTVRYLYEYSRNGENISLLIRTYSSDKDEWFNYKRYLFYYYSDYGPPNEAIVEKWDRNDETWRRSGKYLMRYNFRGKKTRETRATWNSSAREWVNGVRFLFSYDKKLKTERIEQVWNSRTEQWQDAIRYTYSYNERDELKEENRYGWNADKQKWVLVRRMRYAPDKSGPVSLEE